MSVENQFDIIIIGGGIVGLATAFQLSESHAAKRIAVLEKDGDIAQHQSSHNSGVIHSGIYYQPGSLRATNCKRGYDLLLRFCEKHDIPFEICGKIIVATTESERPVLEKILQKGIRNGLEGIRKISAEETREHESHVRAVESIWVPQAGIIDYLDVARKYANLIQVNGHSVLCNQSVLKTIIKEKEIIVETATTVFTCKQLINCAGLYADKVALQNTKDVPIKILPFRGEYYELKPEKRSLVNNLIYPVPNPDFPFLGVHFTRMIKGGIEAGPNAVLAFRREGYTNTQFNAGELMETLAYSGFRKLAKKYWRDGLMEMRRSYSKRLFVSALQKLIPEITMDDVVPGRAGVRAMACYPDGEMADDYIFADKGNVINVLNAPSPAATSSLAIGEVVASKFDFVSF
ncbi:MAG: L-2-hydroxyglutarate oxidase [Saprospiraceae bacterium]|jgi:L-2-hydroxyglutarate oxidase